MRIFFSSKPHPHFSSDSLRSIFNLSTDHLHFEEAFTCKQLKMTTIIKLCQCWTLGSVNALNLNSNWEHLCSFVNDLLLSCPLDSLGYSSANSSICLTPTDCNPAPKGASVNLTYGQGQQFDKLVVRIYMLSLTNCNCNIIENTHMTSFFFFPPLSATSSEALCPHSFSVKQCLMTNHNT